MLDRDMKLHISESELQKFKSNVKFELMIL